jgi:flagellin-like hook-associated protein FlgL
MGLRINQNIAAMNSYRNLSNTDNQLSKSLEKLSSGFRINRAADDAAGLAISEGLRSQVGGLKVAVRNSQDGISVVQTAEGALNETHSILQRMRDLSVQASNDGGLNDDAKGAIQSEMTQLNSELTRIADTTTFNGKKLLDGNYNGTFQVGANAGETIGVQIGTAMGAVGLGVSGVDVTATVPSSATVGGTNASDTAAGTVTFTSTKNFAAVADDVATTGVDETEAADPTAFDGLNGTVSFNGRSFDLGSVTFESDDTPAERLAALNTAAKSALGLTTDPFSVDGTDTNTAKVLTFTVSDDFDGVTDNGGTAVSTSAADAAKATPTYAAASGASEAINLISDAIKTVSTSRADLGALQNRFDHTINNLNVTVENLSASESRIRDADMAQEMMQFTRNQILSQAGTSMLAQANQGSQGVLSLLR